MAEQYPDLVVLLPGILGSELAKGNRIVWGWSGGVLMRNLLSAGDALRSDLWLDHDSPTAEALDDEVRATRLMPDLQVVPGWKIDGYDDIRRYLLDALGLRQGVNFFPFPYDWRRDNRAAAHALRSKAERWLAAWRERSGNAGAKLILIGHSMGGLIARYFLEVLEGWRDTRALITFGTPYAGSMNAIDTLVNSRKFGLDLTDVVRRMSSLHQLLPTYRCCDVAGDELVHLVDASVPGLSAERVAAAAAFHDEIRSAARRNSDDAGYRREPYEIFPIVGYNQPTRHSLRIRGASVELLDTLRDQAPGGDGTVPRQSAVPPGYPLPKAMFASTRHSSLQNSSAALTHVRGIIQSLYLPEFRGRVSQWPVQVSLDVSDVYPLEQSIAIRARPSRDDAALHAVVRDHASGATVKAGGMTRDLQGWHRFDFEPPHAGAFTVIVGGKKGIVEQARDIFEVIDRPAAA